MYYSQLGQDKWVCEIYGGKRGGYFVDVGAWNGVKISNTCHLEKELGWNGICIEPHPQAFEGLKSNRSCICENVCAAAAEGVVQFRCKGKGSMIVTGGGKNVVPCKAETLAVILDRHNAPRLIDYLSLDIEGTELDVLQVFPFERYEFGVMTIEHNAYLGQQWQARRDQMLALLESKGYARDREVGCDDWYINPRLARMKPA